MDIAKVQRKYCKKTTIDQKKNNPHNITFFILDVDYFKSVNDIYGHSAGDQLLIELSILLKKIARESDCVARWGGEEFLIVSRFAEREEAPLMAERIRKSIEQHNFKLPDGNTLKKTCSIGFASYPFLCDNLEYLSWEQVIDIADHALYAAKKSGRNRSVGLAANANADPAMLYLGINSNLKSLIENGELNVIAENSEELIWD
jgi:diguanylate cyclase (GGDEF)-like protein